MLQTTEYLQISIDELFTESYVHRGLIVINLTTEEL